MKLSDHYRYRLYEILPGLSIWLTLILVFSLSFIRPLWMIYFIIIFDVYWLLRVIYFAFYTVVSWRRFRRAVKRKWFELLCQDFPNWAEKINVVFLPMYNENWQVVKYTLESIGQSSYPADKIYIVLSGEERKLEHWQKMQKRV